jgi:hypothetical protein
MTPTQLEKVFKMLTLGFLGLMGMVVLAIIGRSCLLAVIRSVEEKQQQAIIAETRPFIETCQAMPASEAPLPIRGKALIWDMRSDSRSDGHEELPSELRAVPADNEVTVFMIVGEHLALVEDGAGKSGEAGFSQQVDVCVVYWPQKQPAGAYAVTGKPVQVGWFTPGQADCSAGRGVRNCPQYGDAGTPVAAWISTLPREGSAHPIKTAGR